MSALKNQRVAAAEAAADQALATLARATAATRATAKAVAEAQALAARARRLGLDTIEAEAETALQALNVAWGACRQETRQALSEAEKAFMALGALGEEGRAAALAQAPIRGAALERALQACIRA